MSVSRPLGIPALALLGALLSFSLPVASASGEKAPPAAEKDTERRVIVIGPSGRERVRLHAIDEEARGYLGVALVDLTPELRRHFGAREEAGVMVSRVEEGSPAAAAGIQVGDILAAVDGESIEGAWDVRLAVRPKKKGEVVKLDLWRDGRPLALSAKIDERETPQFDIGPMMFWEGEHGEQTPLLEFDTERLEQLAKEMQEKSIVIEEQKARELEKKMQELEEKLIEMEKKLREKSSLTGTKSPVS